MFGMKIDAMKSNFFDREKIVRSTDRATRQVLSKFGAFVRTAARSSIRKRKRSSDEGKPPSSHTGLLKRYIYFAYEPGSQNVVIGPARLNQIGNAPEALEHGGPSRVASGSRRRRKVRKITIRPRPFMHPAFEQEKPKLPAMWADSVRQ